MDFSPAKKQDTAIIIFRDWDDREIGRLEVPAGVDVREQVNAYVRDHLVHPELRHGVDHASLARKDTYRGKYPSEIGGGHTVPDGERYPLTSKLDYAFVKGSITRDAAGKYIITDPDPDDPYPFTHGWAVDPNIVPKPAPNDLWTTMGVAELEDYEHRKRGDANGQD